MILKLVRTPGIYLVGFMGSGKTTVGRLLADRLGWTFVDLDADIEAGQQKTIARIFEREGEARFRELETEAIRERVRGIRSGRPMVVALGGGAFCQPGNVELLAENGVTVWLDCALDCVSRRVAEETNRPLASDPARFEQLYYARREAYARAEYRIDSGGDNPEEAVEAICRLPIFN